MQKQVKGRTVLKYLKSRAENYRRESEIGDLARDSTGVGVNANLEQQLLNQDIQDSALSPDELKIIYAARDEILRAT